MASMFPNRPKTAVLVITTHGGINVEFTTTGGLQPITIAEPDGMDIVLLEAAVCGVVNSVSPSNVVSYTKTVRDAINISEFNENMTKSDMMSIAERVKTEIMQIDDQPDLTAKEISARNSNFIDDPQTIDYYHHNNKFYNIYGDKYIVDKRLSRANELTKPGSRNWKVNLLGALDEDLMDTLNPNISSLRKSSKRHENNILYTHDIIEELEKRGITKVLIFDFTCSVIENIVTKRQVRQTRRSFMQRIGTASTRRTKRVRAKKAIRNKSSRRSRSIDNSSSSSV
jgi:hypothetical protein